MANAYYGLNILGELSDAQTLPNATTADSTNMVYIAGPTNGKLWIQVRANTAISIADTKQLKIEFEAYSSDTAASAVAPFSTSGAVHGTATTSMAILDVTAAGGTAVWAAGEIMVDFAIPDKMLELLSYDYVQLKYTTTANESSEKVDAFVYSRL